MIAQPGKAICLDDFVPRFIQSVVCQVLSQPGEIRIGIVYTGGGAGTTEGSMHCGTPRVTEKVQEVLPGSLSRQPQSQGAMIQEQPGVDIVHQVDQQFRTTFCDTEQLSPV